MCSLSLGTGGVGLSRGPSLSPSNVTTRVTTRGGRALTSAPKQDRGRPKQGLAVGGEGVLDVETDHG